jgi:hypothetical protein
MHAVLELLNYGDLGIAPLTGWKGNGHGGWRI